MELTFHISKDGHPPKRKYTRGACATCRQKKKKCHHEKGSRDSNSPAEPLQDKPFIQYSPHTGHAPQPSDSTDGGVTTPQAQNDPRSTRVEPSQRVNTSQHTSSGASTHRFIGDLNPVVFFVDDASARLLRGRAHQSDVGVWLDGEDEILEHGEDAYHDRLSPHNNANQISRTRHMSMRTDALLPPRQSQEALIDIYFSRIHLALPLINEHEFRAQFKEGSVSPYLLQATCLAASKDHSAQPHLHLANHSGILPLREFANKLYEDLSNAVAKKLERKRVTMIQILALLSLHVSGPESFEEASMYLAQAIHHAHTIGLHLTKGVPTQDEESLVALFWCLWSLDRWNAAIHGRPLVINDRDLGQQLPHVIDLFGKPFRVWLALASTMGEVMVVYRPILVTPVDGNKPEIPRFEEILENCDGLDIPFDLILSLELAYHAIALLASRPWGLKDQPRSHTLYLRQDLSVYRMATLTQMCDISQFLPLPVVSYAISLGFSVSYKQLKRCHLPSTQHIGNQHLQTFYKSLEALSPTWWSAQVMTRLGQRALGGIQRMTERAHQPQAGLNPTERNTRTRPVSSAGYTGNIHTPGLISGLQSEVSPSEAEMVRDQRLPPNSMPAENNQFSFDFANLGNSDFSDLAADPMLQDIDNFLGDFLDINIPKGPAYPLFIDSDVAGNPEGLEYCDLY